MDTVGKGVPLRWFVNLSNVEERPFFLSPPRLQLERTESHVRDSSIEDKVELPHNFHDHIGHTDPFDDLSEKGRRS